MSFAGAVPAKRWGDPPFKVAATATGGARVTYAAVGGCAVDASTGTVTIRSVGKCSLTASIPGGGSGSKDTLTFAIAKAHPTIKFSSASVVFRRPFKALRLGATTDPAIPLQYRVLPTGFDIDDFCTVTPAGALTLSPAPTPTKFPQLDADCLIEVRAAATSPNYDPPAPKRARIHVLKPQFTVRAPSVTRTRPGSGRVTVVVREDSGAAMGMIVQDAPDTASPGQCTYVATAPAIPAPGTHQFTVTIEVAAASSTYVCSLLAQAQPPDWQGGHFEDAFQLTVQPGP